MKRIRRLKRRADQEAQKVHSQGRSCQSKGEREEEHTAPKMNGAILRRKWP